MPPSDGPELPLLLVIDDDGRTARLLARLLKEDGYRVEVVCDGAAALARLARGPFPDAIVTDFRMPHADGMAVAQFARSREPGIPVFIVTGYPELIEDVGLLPKPVVFTKPLTYPELTTALRLAAPSRPQRPG